MSEHAYNDPTISQRLASKGEPVLIMPGEKNLIGDGYTSVRGKSWWM